MKDYPIFMDGFYGYFDDSADALRERFQAVGGLFTYQPRWDRFKAAWQDATKDLVVPFHATDCECGHGQFQSWSKPERDKLMQTLSKLIVKFDVGVFGSAVNVREFYDVFPEAGFEEPYLVCLGTCMAHVAEVMRLAHQVPQGLPKIPIGYYVERRPRTENREKKLYSEIEGACRLWTPTIQLGGVNHRGKQEIGLQAADLIAREVFKFFDNENLRRIRKPILSLAGQTTFTRWNLNSLRGLKALREALSLGESLASMANRIDPLVSCRTEDHPDWPTNSTS